MRQHKLTITIDEGAQTINVVHEEDGIEHSVWLQSLALFGGDAKGQEVFMKLFGASADSAWAYAQGYRIAHSPEGGPALLSFYKQCAAHICKIIDPNAFQLEENAEEVANRWEEKDQTKWFGQDSEDVLEDKQKSEARRKAAERMTDCAEPPADRKKWN